MHYQCYAAGVGVVIGVSSKAERYRQETLLYLPKSMAKMVSVAATARAVVIIMQASWGDGLWGSKRIPAYHAHGLHEFFRQRGTRG
jgi:hypothetical protein